LTEGADALPVPQDSKILLSRGLFDGLSIEDMANVERIFRDTNIEILDLRDIKVRATNAVNAKRDKLAVVMTEEDYSNKEVWNSADKEYAIKSSLLILKDKLVGVNYLYLEGVLKLAAAIMREDRAAIKILYLMLTGTILEEAALDALKDNAVTFAVKAMLRLKPIESFKMERFEEYKRMMEGFLIAA
jgi:hypothetical protein